MKGMSMKHYIATPNCASLHTLWVAVEQFCAVHLCMPARVSVLLSPVQRACRVHPLMTGTMRIRRWVHVHVTEVRVLFSVAFINWFHHSSIASCRHLLFTCKVPELSSNTSTPPSRIG